MRKRALTVAALAGALAVAAGCAGKTTLNSYLLEDAVVGGDAARSIKPIKSILVWPLENIAPGSKSKGVETGLTGVLADTLSLNGGFERVQILEEDQAKDLVARAGEELGLKKKPKTPAEGALIATKLGQLAEADVILVGRIENYDEDKVDKATISVVSASFNLFDAREKAYATIDSFTPVKRVWRTNVKHTSKEGPFNSREGLDDAARRLIADVVERLADDLGQGAAATTRLQEKKIAELAKAAEESTEAGEFDKAVAAWNEVLQIRPDDRRAKAGIAKVEKLKVEAQERAKAAALRKQIDDLAAKAAAAEQDGDLEGALAQWKQVLSLDGKNKDAAAKSEGLERRVAEAKKQAAEEAEKKRAAEDAAKRKAAEETEKRKAAESAARKKAAEESAEVPKAAVPATPAPVAPAAEAPVQKPAAAAPVAPASPAAGAPSPATSAPAAAAPAESGSGDAGLETLRNEAMSAFNREDYAGSKDLWVKILEQSPDDRQAKEMLETTEMLLNALK